MTFSIPIYVSKLGDAKLVRHVYVPALAKSFLVWTYADGGNDRFARKAIDGVEGSDVNITAPLFPIKNFYALNLTTANQVLFLFDDGRDMWQMVVDFATNTIVTAPEIVFTGVDPSLMYDTMLRAFYLRENDLKLRNNITDPEQNIVEMSSLLAIDQDIVRKAVSSRARYVGQHTLDGAIALPARTDAYTYLLYALGGLQVPGVQLTYDTWGLIDLFSYGNVTAGVTGKVNKAFLFDASGYLFRDRLSQTTHATQLSLSMWIKSGAMTMINEYILQALKTGGGIVAQIKILGTPADPPTIPDALTTTIWNAGNGTSYNTVTHSMISEGYINLWHNWVFTKNSAANRQRIYCDTVLVGEITNAFYGLASFDTLQIAGSYPGIIDDVAWIESEVSVSEIITIFTRGMSGLPLDKSILPNLTHYWKLDEEVTNYLRDKSGNNRHMLFTHGAELGDYGFIFDFNGQCFIRNWTVPAALTIEAWIIPNFRAGSENYILRTPNLSFSYANDRTLTFSFAGTYTHTFQQYAGGKLIPGVANHVVISHTFGTPATTFMTINGKVVPASWRVNTTGITPGGESPSFGIVSSTIELGWQDVLQQFRISNVARSQSYVLDYVRGRL